MTAAVAVIAMLLAGATVEPAPQDAAAPVATPPPPVVPTLPTTDTKAERGTEPGEIVVRARVRTPSDPLQAVNAKSFAITQAVDEAIVRPVALTYQKILPDPVRSGIRNIINNLREPVVFLNFLLQLKPGKAAETAARFAINSTVGIAGTFDFAKRKPINLPRRPNGLGNTLGYYGVKPGPFLFLPLLGPTSLRDLFADTADRLVLPTVVGKPFNKLYVAIPIGLFSSLDQRAEYDEKLMAQRETADPYVARREEYLARRQAAIDALHSQKWRDAHPRGVTGTVPLAPASVPR
ncbi:VacJ family lipoprotein [Sphingomonas sp.]|uniref:MlaA family lipoprotein n=1 Tax=Sphingomonas sp. TaxID=28214 RepID=UPI0025DCC3FA|nr:VacJ family lipoprotein [Sphingomonas sp.]